MQFLTINRQMQNYLTLLFKFESIYLDKLIFQEQILFVFKIVFKLKRENKYLNHCLGKKITQGNLYSWNVKTFVKKLFILNLLKEQKIRKEIRD